GVGVEIGAGAFEREDAQEAGLGELVERVVDGGERDGDAGGKRLLVQLLGGKVAVALGEQQLGQRDSLPRRTQACLAHANFQLVVLPALGFHQVAAFPLPFCRIVCRSVSRCPRAKWPRRTFSTYIL